MSSPTYFIEECPTCGRRVQVRVEYLGRQVVCRHCRGSFIARGATGRTDPSESVDPLLQRADELLRAAHVSRETPR